MGPQQTLVENLSSEKRKAWGAARAYRPGFAMRLVLGAARHIKIGTCAIILPDGDVRMFRGHEKTDIQTICVIHDDRVARRILIRGVLGFCEAYLDGYWSSPDMTALFELMQNNHQAFVDLIEGKAWWRRIEGIINRFRINTRQGSRRNIAHHYDLGNNFYAAWLDESMTYSSGIFAPESVANDQLHAAQEHKYAQLVAMLDLKPHHHVLEIGCGWGGFAEYAATKIGCRVTGLTISQAQYDYATQRMAKAGLDDKVDIRLCDYRDVEGQYDRIASIEMFEAVGEKFWNKFFSTVRDRLLPGGIAAMQVITIAEQHFNAYRKGADYIQKYIFPGGLLPTFAHLRDQIKQANLSWRDAHRFGDQYSKTLEEWRLRFTANWPAIKAQGFDERFRRMWEQYLCYCQAGFNAQSIDVCQFSFENPKA